ncbi:MAG: hypothetical protein WCP55_17840 [Lentisphaerota bacterium]
MKKTVRVTFDVEIDYPTGFFNNKFMKDFRGYMYPFMTINDHLEHLAQLEVRGLANKFVEGYGKLSEKGIEMKSEILDIEVLDNKEPK